MKPIGDILKNTYEKRMKAYDEVEQIDTVLKEHINTLSSSAQFLLNNRTTISYKNSSLTIFIPYKLYSPEIHFVANELRELLQKFTSKSIRVVRFVPEK